MRAQTPKRDLTPIQIRAAYELGSDHAEDGRANRISTDALWAAIIAQPFKLFAPLALLKLRDSYDAGHRDFW
jgi:hypothetical protein